MSGEGNQVEKWMGGGGKQVSGNFIHPCVKDRPSVVGAASKWRVSQIGNPISVDIRQPPWTTAHPMT